MINKHSIVAVLLTLTPLAVSEAQTHRGAEAKIAVARSASLQPSDELARLSSTRRREALPDVEIIGILTPDLLARRSSFESLWRDGRYDDALDVLRALEDDALVAGVAVNWRRPQRTLDVKSTEVPLDTSGSADQVLLDFDPISGNLYAVVRWGKSWGFFISMDQGATWSETYHVTANLFISFPDMDLDVFKSSSSGNYAYVAYAAKSNISGTSSARILRFAASTGTYDEAWATKTAFSSDTLGVNEVAVVIENLDLIHYATLLSNGKISIFPGQVSNGSFGFSYHTGIDDAKRGLSAAYHPSGLFAPIWYSYLNTSDDVVVVRQQPVLNPETFIEPHRVVTPLPDSWVDKTSVATYDDDAIIAWEYESGSQGIRVKSYRQTGLNDGDISQHFSTSTGSPDHLYDPQVAGSSDGPGNAMIYVTTAGEVVFQERADYTESLPGPAVTLNEHAVVPGTGDKFAFEWLGQGYGVAYFDADGNVYFSRTWLFSDGFESGNTSAWSATVN